MSDAYGAFAYVYDRLMLDTPYPLWIEFAEAVWAATAKPKTIVDLGCGTGNVSIPLAQRGYRVIGVDLSEDMLAVAAAKSERLHGGLNAQWLQQDMRELELSEPVDAIVSFCDCLNYVMDDADIRRTFERVYASLTVGGRFLFDVHTEFQLCAYADEQPFILREDDVAYIWTCDLDEEERIIEHDLTIFAQEPGSGNRFARIEETHRQRAYPLNLLKSWLKEAGFAQVEVYGDFTFEPVHAETERAFFVAVK